MDLDSALLRAFVTVADELHFGRAAGQLFISQQALSKRIARLEKLLGCRLLERSRGGVTLTPAGGRLLPDARAAVDAVDAAAAAAGDGPTTLRVDVLDEHLAMLPRVRELSLSERGLHLSAVMRADTRDALTTLRTGAADVALGRPGPVGNPWPADLRGAPVLAEPIRLLVPTGHALDRHDGISMTELAGWPLWFPTVGAPPEWTGLLTEMVAAFNLSVDQSGSTFGYDYWLALVAEGSAPPSFIGAAMDLAPGLPISSVPIADPTPVFWWWAIWRRRSPRRAVNRVISALHADAASIERHDQRLWFPQQDRQYLAAR